jgi:uncharacterized protein YcfL
MKKAIIAITAVMFLISCGGSGETVTNDSTTVVDTTVVVDTLTNVDSASVGGQSPHSTSIK